MVKVDCTSIFVNINVPFEKGSVTGEVVYQIIYGLDKKTGKIYTEVEVQDYVNVKYMGMEVKDYEGWKKLRAFHDGLGINLPEIVEAQTEGMANDWAYENVPETLPFLP